MLFEFLYKYLYFREPYGVIQCADLIHPNKNIIDTICFDINEKSSSYIAAMLYQRNKREIKKYKNNANKK